MSSKMKRDRDASKEKNEGVFDSWMKFVGSLLLFYAGYAKFCMPRRDLSIMVCC